jgi:ABC-type multidrug transport system fused ATPase/permease subunit
LLSVFSIRCGSLPEKFTAIQAGFTAVERISDILNEPIEIKDPTTGKKEDTTRNLTRKTEGREEGSRPMEVGQVIHRG